MIGFVVAEFRTPIISPGTGYFPPGDAVADGLLGWLR
jgi:hypothetical protein